MSPAPSNDKDAWQLWDVWKEYENIAMHFNDLLIKLRTQALAGVAAVSVLVGIFSKTDAEITNWKMATVVFVILILFWVAIWCIDFFYYNRLLVGAVQALKEIEELSKRKTLVRHIELSTMIEKAVRGDLTLSDDRSLSIGRRLFYGIVTIALLGGAIFSFYQWQTLPQLT